MPKEVIIVLIGLCSTAFGSLITYLISRRKNKAETLGIELDNANKVIAIWRELSTEQNKSIKELELRVDDLQNDIKVIEAKYKAQCDDCEYKKMYLKIEK